MIKGQHEGLDEASDIQMQQRINLTAFYLPSNLKFNVLFKDVLTRVHSLCNAKHFKAWRFFYY